MQTLSGDETVLVVVDDIGRQAAEILRRHGYRVLAAGSGEEAISICREHSGPIHLLLTGAAILPMAGWDLVQRVRASRPEVRVLFIPGSAGDVQVPQDSSAAAFACLAQPFSAEELLGSVRGVLGASRPRHTVLIVDDQEVIRNVFQAVLAAAGFNTLTAANGKQAVETVRRERVDLVICDLVMPEQEGLETIRQLRQSHPDLKILAVSGAFGGSFLKAARLLGAAATLRKPVAPEDLVKNVESLLGADRPAGSSD